MSGRHAPRPIAAWRVIVPIIAPIMATCGDLLLEWPGHPTHALAVTDATGGVLKRSRHISRPEGRKHLATLARNGVIQRLSPLSRHV